MNPAEFKEPDKKTYLPNETKENKKDHLCVYIQIFACNDHL